MPIEIIVQEALMTTTITGGVATLEELRIFLLNLDNIRTN